MTEQETKYFICGFATACAELCRGGYPDEAAWLMDDTGYTLAHFIEAGVEDYDIEALKEAGITDDIDLEQAREQALAAAAADIEAGKVVEFVRKGMAAQQAVDEILARL